MEENSAAQAVESRVEETVQSVGQLQQFLQDRMPDMIAFGIRVLLALLVFFAGHQLIKWVRKLVRRSMERAGSDTGIRQFVDSLMKYGLHILLVILIANSLGVESASVAALLASGGVGISLALQGSLSNLAGGFLILILKPFVVGDYIIEDTYKNEGTVTEIQIFYTRLATVDNQTIVIPNGTLANASLTNMTNMDYRQLNLRVSISYEADLRTAKKLLEELLLEDDCVMKEREHNVFVDSLGESAVVLGCRGWVRTEDYWPTRWRLLEAIKLTLDDNGIEIPYQQMNIHIKGGEKV